jgi:hypothetical protein
MMEMRREDGRLIRGIYRGAASFGNSTFAALIGAAEQTIFFLQVSFLLIILTNSNF